MKPNVHELSEKLGFVDLLLALIPKTRKDVKTSDGFHLLAREAEYRKHLRRIIAAASEHADALGRLQSKESRLASNLIKDSIEFFS